MKRRSLAGSMIGGIPETQEMPDFCAEHGIVADTEMIRADEVNEAYERMINGDVKYRSVIDNASLAIGPGQEKFMSIRQAAVVLRQASQQRLPLDQRDCV